MLPEVLHARLVDGEAASSHRGQLLMLLRNGLRADSHAFLICVAICVKPAIERAVWKLPNNV